MNIKETLNLKAGTKLKCIYPYKDKFQEEKTYEIEDFNSNGSPTIFAKESDFLPYTANGLLNDGRLIVCFGSECAIFEIIEDEEEATNANTQDYNIGDKLTCVESDRHWFTKDREYAIEELLINADGLRGVYITDDDGDSTVIDVTNPEGLHIGGCHFVKSDSIKKPTPSEIMEALLKDGPHYAFVDDDSEELAAAGKTVCLITGKDKTGWYKTEDGISWKYAVAVDARGNVITEI